VLIKTPIDRIVNGESTNTFFASGILHRFSSFRFLLGIPERLVFLSQSSEAVLVRFCGAASQHLCRFLEATHAKEFHECSGRALCRGPRPERGTAAMRVRPRGTSAIHPLTHHVFGRIGKTGHNTNITRPTRLPSGKRGLAVGVVLLAKPAQRAGFLKERSQQL